MDRICTIAFDADDTLWVNEPYFREAEDTFCGLLEDYLPHHSVHRELFATEIANLPLYGYGIKAFTLSMIETVVRLTEGRAPAALVERALQIGKDMLQKPVELLDGVADTLEKLTPNYRLVLATKGDLLDQERKLEKSGLARYFHHIEVMSDKQVNNYQKLMRHLDCRAEEFMMVGNSMKSDVIPVLTLGGYAVHVPYHITWDHEQATYEEANPRFLEATSISDVLKLLP